MTPTPLSPRVPELGALDLLVTLARLGSLGRTARFHGVSQQAVSSRIRRMEHLLGIALIERTGTGSRLTRAGGLVVDWAQEVVQAAHGFEWGVEALRATSGGHLVIAASRTVAEYLVPGWLVASQRESPEVRISLEVCNSTQVARRVREGNVAVGFTESPSRPAQLRSATIRRDELCVVVAPEHPWATRRTLLSVEELARTPLVEREPGSGTRQTLHAALEHAGVSAHSADPVVELSSSTEIKSAVADGVGPAVISSLAISQEVYEHRMVRVRVAGLDLSRPMRAVWPAGRSLLGPSRNFVALARRVERMRA